MPERFKVFEAADADMFGRVFEAAWAALLETHPTLASDQNELPHEKVREALAMRIIAAAQDGERDPEVLQADALAYVASGILGLE